MAQSLFTNDGSLAPLMFAVGAGLLIAMLLRRSSRRLGKRNRANKQPVRSALDTPPEPIAAAASSVGADRYAVELHDLARDLTGQLDSKMILLQELIAQSDRQISRLEELLDAAEKKEPRMRTDEHG